MATKRMKFRSTFIGVTCVPPTKKRAPSSEVRVLDLEEPNICILENGPLTLRKKGKHKRKK